MAQKKIRAILQEIKFNHLKRKNIFKELEPKIRSTIILRVNSNTQKQLINSLNIKIFKRRFEAKFRIIITTVTDVPRFLTSIKLASIFLT